MMELALKIPEEVLFALKLPPSEVDAELRKELALALYQRGVLPLGKARVLASMKRRDFEELLGSRQIARHSKKINQPASPRKNTAFWPGNNLLRMAGAFKGPKDLSKRHIL